MYFLPLIKAIKHTFIYIIYTNKQKSHIRETLNLSTNTIRGVGSDDVTCVGQIVS